LALPFMGNVPRERSSRKPVAIQAMSAPSPCPLTQQLVLLGERVSEGRVRGNWDTTKTATVLMKML
jgi:hypothetical protein